MVIDFSLLEFSSDILKTVSQALTMKQFMQPYAYVVRHVMGIWAFCGVQCVGTV